MSDRIRTILESHAVEASAPCRIDMGGTLDISSFYYPLRHLAPCTFNIALDMRTTVRLLPHEPGRIQVSSKGFESAEFPLDRAPFRHPLGLIFAIATYFRAGGVHIEIESQSPPRSALGGSSVAAVALVGAFSSVLDKIGEGRHLYRREIAMFAHVIEESVAGVPCGLQDQLAAVYGGVNAWHWYGKVKESVFEKQPVVKKNQYPDLEARLLLAFCGKPHVSRDINSKWVDQFLSGNHYDEWRGIIERTHDFIRALEAGEYSRAGEAMRAELAIRRQLTPEVLTPITRKLAEAAEAQGCGARFTGAGGGGCMWALGEPSDIQALKPAWEAVLSQAEGAGLLDLHIDDKGLSLPIL